MMAEDWKTAPGAGKVLDLADDPRPAWLWAGHGDGLLWSNAAADLFGAKLKSSGLKRADDPRPVKGQITRILRLGLANQSMLSRMQFIAGRKPLSATCRCTPLTLGEQACLLVVGVDPIASEVLEHARANGRPDVVDVPPEESGGAAAEQRSGLGALVDKLARDKRLFEPLDETDDAPPPSPEEAMVPGRDFARFASEGEDEEAQDAQSDWGGGHEAEADADEAAFAADGGAEDGSPRAGLWQLTGRGVTYTRAEYEEPQDEDTLPEDPSQGLEQASRYNFEELSRILNERIGQDGEPGPPLPEPEAARGGALVPLSDEALVLNRLPLGILIFRDQDIVFVNRTLVDMTGYENASMLRAAGPGAIFPAAEANAGAGPVTHLLARNGDHVSVSARLQTVTWQGRHAVMLSARAVESRRFSESEVKTFAALCAQLEGGAFIEADRSGRVETVLDGEAPSGVARGDTLASAIAASAREALLAFLARPAQFAETERPGIRLAGRKKGDTLLLFAEGRAGLVTGYFGIYAPARPEAVSASGLPAASLKRISRELRQPLNTISGFSELMTSEAFGPLSNARYAEYARDIQAAGQAIGDLADELDDFIRLAEGASSLSPADIDLSALLADCLVRVRSQAGAARVLLRSAISEKLPFVRADAATLKQAVLNMLASAIAETRAGSKVVLSAQSEEDGSVTIHVRDAQKAPNALAEQFVVFRDGQARDGAARVPVRSSIGLTLTRSLVSVNACSFTLAPASETGTLMTLTIPAQLVVAPQ